MYIYMTEYYSVMKNNAICSSVGEPRTYHTK